ncbi:hypothetical protein AgCh_031899 [Apium graveolens]
MVDAFAAVEQYRLDWIRAHQNIIRSNLYKSIRDSVSKSDTNSSTKGKNVILPATHTGSQRYMNQYFKDSLAIYRTIGHPSLFLTMTCNTQWPEIKSMMNFFPGVDVADKPDVTARVFKLKLDQLLDLIKNKNYFGKYIRGHDTATMILRKKQQGNEASTSSSKPKSNDEIKNFLDGRYICVSEASWRLLGFDIHNRFSTVEHLSVHLEGEKSVSFKQHENLQDVAEKAKKRFSKLEGWFQANKNIPEARQFIYHQFPQNFTWKQDQNRWKIRERGTVFGRLYDAHASSGETFYLCIILMHIKGATSFKDLRTVNGIVYNTYKEACDALGLLKDDKQWDVAMLDIFDNVMANIIYV